MRIPRAALKHGTTSDAITHACKHKLTTLDLEPDDDIDRLSDEVATTDYDISVIKRRPGRPTIGSAAAEIVPVRIDPELVDTLNARANREHTNRSEIIRRALREYLAS